MEPGARFASASDSWTRCRPILARTQRCLRRWPCPRCRARRRWNPTSRRRHQRQTPGGTNRCRRSWRPATTNTTGSRPDDDVSADLPLIASAGSAPMFEVAADDRPGFFAVEATRRATAASTSARLWMPRTARAVAGDCVAVRCPGRSGRRLTPEAVLGAPPVPRAVDRADRWRRGRLRVGLLDGVARCRARDDGHSPRLVASAPAAALHPRRRRPPRSDVDEPKVLGESKLPPPSRAARRPAAPAARFSCEPNLPLSPAARRGQARLPWPRLPARSAAERSRRRGRRSRPPGSLARRLAARRRRGHRGRPPIGVTPVTLDDLAPGEHRVVLQIPGFNLWATTAQVKAGSRTRVAASLERGAAANERDSRARRRHLVSRRLGRRAGRDRGEVVFNTSMTGYQEVLTDPSYAGQIVTMTCAADRQLRRVAATTSSRASRRWPASSCATSRRSPATGAPQATLRDYLVAQQHRRHRRHRHAGADAAAALGRRHARRHRDRRRLDPQRWSSRRARFRTMEGSDLVQGRHLRGSRSTGRGGRRRVRSEFGVPPERRAKRRLQDRRLRLRHQVEHPAAAERARLRRPRVSGVDAGVGAAGDASPDGVFLSNGPGDPAPLDLRDRQRARRSSTSDVPMFGICLGHQILGLALGGKTFKLKFGHRGAQPSGEAARRPARSRSRRRTTASPSIRSRCRPTSR